MVFVDMASLIPENHLLRKIDGMVSFDFIYGLLAPYYSATGRPSVDPVSMFKMLLVGYLYGIKSERRLVEEIRLNIAYRWFCGFELDDAIPDHSTFSKTRTRKWQQSGLFQNAFYEIVKQCIACGLIDGKAMAADGSYIPANVSRESWVDVETEVEQSMQSYLDALDEELSQQPGFKKPPERTIKKRRTTSRTDPDSGYINHGNKRGIGYLMEATVDCKHGILTGVDVYPANEKESLLVLRHLEQQIKLGVPMNQLALDRGYDTGAVHRGLELLGVTGYIPAIQFPNAPEKYGFSYNPQRDAFICPEGVGLTYHRLNCNQSTGKYLRCYQIEDDACKHCVKRPSCFDKAGIRRRVLASSCYPAFFRGHQRVGTPEFLSMMRLRKIWAEGSFSVLKREHCISKIRKRGILAATEECLLAAMALNLKRMASAVFFYLHISYSAGTTAGFGSFLAFVNGSLIGHPLQPQSCLLHHVGGAHIAAGHRFHKPALSLIPPCNGVCAHLHGILLKYGTGGRVLRGDIPAAESAGRKALAVHARRQYAQCGAHLAAAQRGKVSVINAVLFFQAQRHALGRQDLLQLRAVRPLGQIGTDEHEAVPFPKRQRREAYAERGFDLARDAGNTVEQDAAEQHLVVAFCHGGRDARAVQRIAWRQLARQISKICIEQKMHKLHIRGQTLQHFHAQFLPILYFVVSV